MDTFAHITPTGATVVDFHRQCFDFPRWPHEIPVLDSVNVWHWVAQNHRNNCLLWDEEDLARRTRASDGEITANKRAIDKYNQARNDATERVDEFLLLELGLIDPATVGTDQPRSLVAADARLNSETGGSIIDRLSIMSLKVKAMTAQTARNDVDVVFIETARAKLSRLEEQRGDLARCFDELLRDCRSGQAYFKVYRQFKMYNDPKFNPVLVAESKHA